jgi:hypothetical protein
MGKLHRSRPRLIWLSLLLCCGLCFAAAYAPLSLAAYQSTPTPEVPSPFTAIGRLLWLVGKPILLVIGVFVGFILLLNLYGRARELAGGRTYTPQASAKLLAASILLVASALWLLPRSEALILRSWEDRTGGISERSFFYDKLFGVPPNHYESDIVGRVTSLEMHRLSSRDVRELRGLGRLTSLRYLDLSDTPLEGTFDVSALTALRTLRLRNTRLTRVMGLERLAELDELDLEGSPIESLQAVGGVRRLNLSRTSVTELNPLTAAGNLEALRLEGCDFSRLRSLEQLWRLKLLSLNGCRAVDLQMVTYLSALESLFIDHTDVTDLRPLTSLRKLQWLSIVDTPVKDLAGLRGSTIAILSTDNPAFNDQSVAAAINHPVAVFRADMFNHDWVPAHVARRAKLACAALVLLALALMLPSPAGWRTRLLLKLRRVTLALIPGALLVLLLWVISSLDIPLSVVGEETPTYGRALRMLMWFIGGAWLVAAPVLSLLTDLKPVGVRSWSVLTHLLSRVLPPVAAASPILLFIGSGMWGMMSGPGATVVLILLLLLWCCVAAFYGILATVWVVSKRKGKVTGSYSLLVPVGVVLVTALFSIGINLFGSSSASVRGRFVLFLLFPVLPVLWFGLITFMVALSWGRRAKRLRRLLAGEEPTQAVVEVPLRKSPWSIPGLPSLYQFVKGMGVSALLGDDVEIISAQNVGQVARARVRPGAAQHLRGLALVLQHRELVRAKRWELKVMTDLVKEAYGHTWAPIWVVGDWIGELQPASAETQRRVELLNALVPYVSGMERFSVAGGSVFDPYPPDALAECLRANQLVPMGMLTEVGLPELLRGTFTPVALLCRGVFGQANIPNRLDSLVRAAEVAAASIALVLVAEREALRAEGACPPGTEKLDRSIRRALSAPLTFSGWVGLLDAFAKAQRTPLALYLAGSLAAPVRVAEAKGLRAMVEAVGGQNAVASVGADVATCRDVLSLLVAFRNVVSAHGPITERNTPELYSGLLLVTLDFLSALPWSSFSVHASGPSGRTFTHRGCLPESRGDASGTGEGARAWAEVEAGGGRAPVRFDLSKYFRASEDGLSLAMYTGLGRYTDPVSGEQLSREDVADAA